jgi:predicted enzyme related to lactoylglutathione lyase
MTTPLFAGRIAQIALGVRDLPSATAFWRDVVGLTLMFEAPNVAFFDCDGLRLMLGHAEPEAPPPSGTVLYFDSTDLDADFARVRDAGASVAREPHPVAPLGGGTLWMAFFRDPEGHLFALTSLR